MKTSMPTHLKESLDSRTSPPRDTAKRHEAANARVREILIQRIMNASRHNNRVLQIQAQRAWREYRNQERMLRRYNSVQSRWSSIHGEKARMFNERVAEVRQRKAQLQEERRLKVESEVLSLQDRMPQELKMRMSLSPRKSTPSPRSQRRRLRRAEALRKRRLFERATKASRSNNRAAQVLARSRWNERGRLNEMKKRHLERVSVAVEQAKQRQLQHSTKAREHLQHVSNVRERREEHMRQRQHLLHVNLENRLRQASLRKERLRSPTKAPPLPSGSFVVTGTAMKQILQESTENVQME